MRNNLAEIIDIQNRIIKNQSDILNKALLLLLQYMSAEELDNSDIVKDINAVAELRACLK